MYERRVKKLDLYLGRAARRRGGAGTRAPDKISAWPPPVISIWFVR